MTEAIRKFSKEEEDTLVGLVQHARAHAKRTNQEHGVCASYLFGAWHRITLSNPSNRYGFWATAHVKIKILPDGEGRFICGTEYITDMSKFNFSTPPVLAPFNLGDTVRVTKRIDWPFWFPSMDRFIGKSGRVTSISPDSSCGYNVTIDTCDGWHWPIGALARVIDTPMDMLKKALETKANEKALLNRFYAKNKFKTQEPEEPEVKLWWQKEQQKQAETKDRVISLRAWCRDMKDLWS